MYHSHPQHKITYSQPRLPDRNLTPEAREELSRTIAAEITEEIRAYALKFSSALDTTIAKLTPTKDVTPPVNVNVSEPTIKLVDFHIQKNWDIEILTAGTAIDAAQDSIRPGTVLDQQFILDHAVECIWNGDLVAGAATLYALADHNGMLKPA